MENEIQNLIIRAKNGDKNAFEEVYSAYYTPIFRYLLSRIRNKDEAIDIAQDVFLKVLNFLPNYKENHTSPKAFFFRVAKNTLIDHVRKKKEIVSDEIVIESLSEQPFKDKEIENIQTKEIIEQIRKHLNEEQQQIITLIYTNDLSYKEISEILNKKEDNIRQIHSRAIKKLRDLYTKNE